jgi:membrane protein implicated in regulation of membrane protease activity
MYLVALAWIYVVLMMAVAEGMAPNGTVLGALFTFVLYGVLPLSIVLYLLGTPGRRRARQRAEAASTQPDGGTQPPRDPVAPEREEP